MRRSPNRWLRFLGLGVAALLGLYFTYHAVYGTQGLRREQVLAKDVQAKQEELDKLHAEREALEKRTQGLRPESIDPDMLDEEARKQLGYGKDGEKVILTP
ncbi:MAG: septum formation initiator family protein [Bdellovibrionales bacterium]